MDIDDEDIFGGQRNPTLPQPPAPQPQPSTLSRWDPARTIGGRWYPNIRRPSNAGQSENKWCSTGHHHQPQISFVENGRTYQTCNNCRAHQRRYRANQSGVNANAQVLQQLEQQVSGTCIFNFVF